MKTTIHYVVSVATMLIACPAWAGDHEIEQLQQQLEQLKREYNDKLENLEKRILATEQANKQANKQENEQRTALNTSPPVVQNASSASNKFNPDISLILDGRYGHLSNDPASYRLPGFMLGDEAGPGERGLALGESELVLSANADDKFYGRFTASFGEIDGETEVAVEEAYLKTLGLGMGLSVKAGRFYSDIGYMNSQHSHQWDFADVPLIYRGLFGNQLTDDGLQLSWLAPLDMYLSFGTEAFRATAFPLSAKSGNAPGAYTLYAKTGGDIGISNSWLAGVSYLDADTDSRQASRGIDNLDTSPSFRGNSKTWGIDLVWKWAPNGNRRQRNLQLQYEYYHRDDNGYLDSVNQTASYKGSQSGWYAQAIYQFIPRWRMGLRYDAVDSSASGSSPELIDAAGLDSKGYSPSRYSLMADWSNSEFSRLRLQYNHDQSSPVSEDQWIAQYILSLGAHGAHSY